MRIRKIEVKNLFGITLLAGRDYHPRSYPGRVVLFRATDHRPGEPPDPFIGWDQVVSGELEMTGFGLEVVGYCQCKETK